MRMPAAASVPLGTPRPVSEVSITTSALAPARWALNAFSRKKHSAAVHERYVAGGQAGELVRRAA